MSPCSVGARARRQRRSPPCRPASPGCPRWCRPFGAYTHGPDLRLGDGRWDYAVVGDFDDGEGYQAYVDHPAHDDVRRELIVPLIADRGHVQISL